ncbi:MAG: Ig-like domain-containing protein [Acidobacteriota bacterium]
MQRKLFSTITLFSLLIFNLSGFAFAQQSKVKKVEVTPNNTEYEVGQQIKFSAVGKDESGKGVTDKALFWFALPSDVAGADKDGNVTFFTSGEVTVGAVIGGQIGYAKVRAKPGRVTKIEIESLTVPLTVGSNAKLHATARTANGDPRSDVTFKWASSNPAIATVDGAGVITAIKPGKTKLTASTDTSAGEINIDVVANPVQKLAVEPQSINVRTGDVVRFKVNARDVKGAAVANPSVRWAVSGNGAMIEADGAFVAETPGTYIITAISGNKVETASVVVVPRNAEREIEVVGRAPVKDFMAAEQWIFGNYAYLSTITNKLLVYDISDPTKPKLTDSIEVDARITNDISTTADFKIAVMSREGASNRKNGIVFFDTSDPAHPKKISEYTETVSGGVHSAFVDGHYVYLTDDATGSMRVIDFKDVKNPKEVARWQVNSVIKPVDAEGGAGLAGRYLHDVQVVDGLAYLAYWRDGLVILDVGKGIKGGSPENPQLVSQYRFNHSELYGDGWIAGTHAVYRYKNYVFLGDEVFPIAGNLFESKERFPARGIVHIIDVSDITKPRKVAEYAVPEWGSHNMWVKDDIMYMGYYGGGGRVVDVSGELRGDLYRQGREIAKVYTGALDGFHPNQAFCWGAQPYKDMVFFNDVNTGIWITKLGKPKFKGSTTTP